ncbi:MAG: hypothetical protein J6M35_09500 [Clostridia bacterium]|nr:hypothetical protein [Clostridia bacterium]
MITKYPSEDEFIFTTDDVIGDETKVSVTYKHLIEELSEEFNSIEVVFYHALLQAKKIFSLEKGDNVVLTGGQINGEPRNTNTIKVEIVK